jgi:hypothetical protein
MEEELRMKSDLLQEEFWKIAAERSDSTGGPSFEWPEGASAAHSVSFVDRLALLYLNGFLPVLLLALIGFLLAGGPSPAAVSMGVVLLAPVVAGFFVPFVRTGGMVSALRLILLGIPILGCCIGASLLPAAVVHHLEGNFLHLEYCALVIQRSVENALSVPSLTLFATSIVLLVLGIGYLTPRFPWLEFEETSRLAIVGRIVLASFLTLWVVGLLDSGFKRTSEIRQWRDNLLETFSVRPYYVLPPSSGDRFWADRVDVLKSVAKDAPRVQNGMPRLTPDQLTKLRSKFGADTSLEAHPPSSAEEWDQADSFYLLMGSYGGLDSVSSTLFELKLYFLKRPHGDNLYTEKRIPEMLDEMTSMSVEPEVLQRWSEQIKELRASLFDRMEELDMAAVWFLSTHRQTAGEKLGWYAPEAVTFVFDTQRRTEKAGWHYNAVIKPTPVKIAGWTVKDSPTELAMFYQEQKLIRDWFRLRSSFQKMSLSEQQQVLATRRDALGVLETTEYKFWRTLHSQNHVANERALLETAEVIVELRLCRAREGAWPKSLQDVNLGFEPTNGRYLWSQTDSGWVLKDRTTNTSYRFSS